MCPKQIRNMPPTQPEHVLRLADTQGVVRSSDLASLGIPRVVLQRLVEVGELIRVSRGLYMRPDANITEHHTLVEVAARAPGVVMNLLTALAFHELTDELPSAVWIAIRRGCRPPKLDSPRLEVSWTAPRFLELGVTRHRIEGIDVAVTDPSRTVVDCFKYRSRVGLDVAIASLRAFLARHRTGREELRAMAEACRVRTVIRPYIESLS